MFEHFKVQGEGSLGARLMHSTRWSYTDYVKKFLNYFAPLLEMAESKSVFDMKPLAFPQGTDLTLRSRTLSEQESKEGG